MIIKKSPREFLSDRRFDMITRYLFFMSLKNKTNQQYFEDLYRRAIYSRTKGKDGPGPYTHHDYHIKQSVNDYVREAKNLFVSMSQNGFDPDYPVPFNRNGILNGCHRVACALALDIDVWAQEYDNTTLITIDSKWLEKTFSSEDISLIKETYLNLTTDSHYQKKISESDPLLSIITSVGINVKHNPLYTARQGSIQNHINHTRQEFIGKPEVCARVMEQIVHIRRNKHAKDKVSQLYELVNKYIDVICEHCTTRWLLSIVDTYACHGTGVDREKALAISTFVNMLILADTCLGACDINQIPSHKFDPHDEKFSLEYQCMMVNTQTGDNLKNLLVMITKDLDSSKIMSKIWKTIFVRIKNTDNMITKLEKIHQKRKSGFY